MAYWHLACVVRRYDRKMGAKKNNSPEDIRKLKPKDVAGFRIWNKWRNPKRGFNAEKSALWFPAFFPFFAEIQKSI